MSGAFEAKGEKRALASLARAAGAFKNGLHDAAELAGQLLARDVTRGMQEGPQSGTTHPGAKRQSSAPGEYPAIQSGQLVGSIEYEVQGSHALTFGSRGALNRGYDYAVGLHEGNARFASRPYLTLTVNRTQAEVTRILGETVYRKVVGG